MSTAILLALVLGYACLERAVGTLDTARPLVRFSPTRGMNDSLYDDDGFGFSAAIHHTVENLSGLTLEEVLGQVRIIAGAPRGRFPGGFDDMFPDELDDPQVCQMAEEEFEGTGTTPRQNRTCFGISGLVYVCRASTSSCEPFLGNGNKTTEDGYLYKRNPNIALTPFYFEYTNQAMMGATMFSTGDYFVACAPRFSYRRSVFRNDMSIRSYEPRGRCVFSRRNLQDFQIIDPCSILSAKVGSDINQAEGGYCQSGTSLHISESNKVLVGTPGYDLSKGGFGFYDDLTVMGQVVSQYPISYGIPAVTQPPDIFSEDSFTYFGFGVVSGNFNGSESYVTSSLRYRPANSSTGAINIISDLGDPAVEEENLLDTVTTMLGNQLGESFGKVLVAADLNGDGLDELVVSAPTYSDSNSRSPELGRVYILTNVDTSGGPVFQTVAMLTGSTRLGRFGHAVTNLGDLNNDGLEDIAISAPYGGPGVVHIHYGSATSYIESTPRQTITGQDMMNRVSELDSLTSFGTFLQGNADIDNNQYRDLLIGAEESQALFVLRARPVANISLTVSANETAIVPSIGNCILPSDGMMHPCFEVTVCGTYTGRGLTSFDAVYTISEIRDAMAESRLIFEDPPPLSFTQAGVEACSSLTAYVTLEVSGELDDLSMMVEMQQFQLPTAQVNTTLQFTDLSTEPDIVSAPAQTTVGIAIDCDNNVCRSDLRLQLNSISYLNSSGDLHPNQNQLTVGAITSMKMNLTYSNSGDQALNFRMLITLPEGFVLFTPETQSGVVTCLERNDANDGADDASTVYLCTDFQVPLAQNESRNISFIWGEFGSSLIGNEGTLSVSAEIEVVNRTENFEPPALLEDNSVQVDVPVVAEAAYSVQVTYPPTTPTYVVSETAPEVDSSSQLGSPLPITVTFTNSGPSTLRPHLSLVIFLPLRNATDTGDYYYIYVLDVNDEEAGISCTMADVREIENPSNLALDGRRRKRQRLQRSAPSIMDRVFRTIRQDSPEITLDCSRNQELCSRLECNLTEIGAEQSRTLVIRTRIDNRFFFDKNADYRLTTFVRVVDDATSFIDTTGSTRTLSAPVTLSMQEVIPDQSGIPGWVIAICAIAGVVFIIIVAIVLALLIFLHVRRRKMRGEHEVKEEDEVETYNEKAFEGDGVAL